MREDSMRANIAKALSELAQGNVAESEVDRFVDKRREVDDVCAQVMDIMGSLVDLRNKVGLEQNVTGAELFKRTMDAHVDATTRMTMLLFGLDQKTAVMVIVQLAKMNLSLIDSMSDELLEKLKSQCGCDQCAAEREGPASEE